MQKMKTPETSPLVSFDSATAKRLAGIIEPTPDRIIQAKEVLHFLLGTERGMVTMEGESILPERQLTPVEMGLRNAACEALRTYILGESNASDVEPMEPQLITVVPDSAWAGIRAEYSIRPGKIAEPVEKLGE